MINTPLFDTSPDRPTATWVLGDVVRPRAGAGGALGLIATHQRRPRTT